MKKQKSRNQVIALDLGSQMTKAVHIQRRGGRYSLVNYSIHEAPEKGFSDTAALGKHLKEVSQSVGNDKRIVIALSSGDSMIRRAELPMVPVSNMRKMLKFGSKNYLQQELPNYLFDCAVLAQKQASSDGGAEASKTKPKCQVLVGGAPKNVIENIKAAAKQAGLVVEHITPGQAGPANAYEMSFSDTFKEGVIALVDIGYKNTSVSILMEGEMVFSRVLGFGGDKLTKGLAEALGINYPEAEGIKVGLSSEVEESLQESLTPLARELRASIDFFEHQHDLAVDKMYFSGGTARSESIIQHLQAELMTPCESWNPTNCYDVSLPPERLAEIEECASQLTVALGVAASRLI